MLSAIMLLSNDLYGELMLLALHTSHLLFMGHDVQTPDLALGSYRCSLG